MENRRRGKVPLRRADVILALSNQRSPLQPHNERQGRTRVAPARFLDYRTALPPGRTSTPKRLRIKRSLFTDDDVHSRSKVCLHGLYFPWIIYAVIMIGSTHWQIVQSVLLYLLCNVQNFIPLYIDDQSMNIILLSFLVFPVSSYCLSITSISALHLRLICMYLLYPSKSVWLEVLILYLKQR